MKIIQVSPRFHPYIGGIETHVFEISKRLAKNHDVHVFTTDPSGRLPREECIGDIKIKRFRSFAPKEAFFFSPELYSALKKEHASILHIHSNQSLSSLLAFMGMNRTNIKKIIFTPHYSPQGTTPLRKVLRKIYDKIQNRIFYGADRIVCVSDYEIKLITKGLQVPRKKLVKIPNGIDLKKFQNVPKVKKEHDFQILFVGRLEKYKRVQWILHAVKGLINKFPDKDIHFVVVGKGPYKKELLSLCNDLDLKKYVTFKGGLPYDELLKEFSRCDVFVLPSAFEIFGIVVLEALAFNKPIIVSNDGALPELFGKYGFVVKSIEGLEKSLTNLMGNVNQVKTDFDIKNYTWDRIAAEILELYKKVLSE